MERKRRKGEQGEGRRKVERWMEQGERKKRRKEEKGGRERGGEEEPVTHKTIDDKFCCKPSFHRHISSRCHHWVYQAHQGYSTS